MYTETAKHKADVSFKADNIIFVERLPIIRQQLGLIKENINESVKNALDMECNEQTIKDIKAVRARLKKDFEILEKKRIDVKRRIMSPYEAFENIYKDCVTSVYIPADEKLKEKINDVENKIKKAKREEIECYFNEYCRTKNIDFITFQMTNINVNLSSSKKSLKNEAKDFVDKVWEELELINSHEYSSEILIEYKASLNIARAINTVILRHKAIDEENKRIENMKKLKCEKEKAAQEVITIVERLNAPKEISLKQNNTKLDENERILKTVFTIKGTKKQLLELKQFLENGGYYYE